MKNFAIGILLVGGLAFLSACESGQAADNSARNVADRPEYNAAGKVDANNAAREMDAKNAARKADADNAARKVDADNAARKADADDAARKMDADHAARNVPADNSGRNVADRKDSAVTAGDQSNAQADLDATQKIRQAVVADDSLSINAQNVKIITSKGVVTLRGPVANADEKASIGRIAQNVAGVTRVDNQIEIAN